MQSAARAQQRIHYLATGLLAGLFAFSLYLALTRIYQVDEAQNIFTARIMASHWEGKYYLSIELWHLWPLTWLASRIQESVSLFHAARLFMLVVFWLNILLTALNCGLAWNSKKFLWILLGAATLAPLWDYGFEVRHENVLLLFFLLYLFSFRLRGGHFRLVGLLLGALAALMQFMTFKAFVYWLPMAALFLAFPPGEWALSRFRTFLFGCLGFFSLVGITILLLHLSGRLPYFLAGVTASAGLSVNASVRFWPWDTLARLINQTPLLLGVAVAACVHTLASLGENWREHCNWTGVFPETVLCLVAVLALMVNPAPYPYNLCLLVPFAYILAIRWILSFQDGSSFKKPKAFLWVGLAVFTHVTPFLKATLRHLDRTNDRQEQLMGLAEKMTDPVRDRVYDAAGLVASRESIGHQWFLHTLIMERIYRGQLPSVRRMLQEQPASVLIPSYRFSWLQQEDRAYIQSNYLALANDFLVLGQVLQSPNRQFTCLQPGRYFITSRQTGSELVRGPLIMDGAGIPVPSVQFLSRGVHSFKAEEGLDIVIGWVGPNLNGLPNIGPGDANTFFFNWY